MCVASLPFRYSAQGSFNLQFFSMSQTPLISTPWWQHAVFYEIYPRSFLDTNADGIGDLNGITSKLDYLVDLGIDAIWITPFFPSPQIDFGYDVSDYENVDPQFGTLADFDRLIAEAHRLGIRVITDLVLNHTSDQHAYFQAARSSKDSPYRDWYIWRDPVNGGPPNNWISAFGPRAWTFDPHTGQYYYHFFYPEQPDLNWRNPEVEEAMFASVRFWLERGVDGFRLDAINWLFEDSAFPDNPWLSTFRPGSTTEHQQDLKFNRDLPETHETLCRLRAFTDKYNKDCVLIGEISVPTIEELVRYYGSGDDELQLPFNFFIMEVPRLDAWFFRTEVERAERALRGSPTTSVLSNHDQPRAFDRYGDGAHNDQIAKLLAVMLLTLRGTPFIYYGEEIGMETTEPMTLEEVRDPVGKRYWPGYKGRDGERTPMQWTGDANAGFTTGTPWLKVPPSTRERNVETALRDPSSILNFYKRIIRLRRESPALLDGEYTTVGNDPHIFAYSRRSPTQTMIIALNMSSEKQSLRLDEATLGDTNASRLHVRFSNLRSDEQAIEVKELTLAPYEAMVLEVIPIAECESRIGDCGL